MARLNKLESIIGYTFLEPQLLEQAITHRSYADSNNERLEFLGDAILNYTIASAVFRHISDATEGELSRLRASLVKQSTLATIARELDLGTYLRMGSGELKSGGFERDSILSDTLEAIIGAIYLDRGIEEASRVIHEWFADRLDGLSRADVKKDAKSRLQEYLQSIGESVPEYVLLRTRGKSPNQVFEVACHAANLDQPVRANGSSRRRAEQKAARDALALMEASR